MVWFHIYKTYVKAVFIFSSSCKKQIIIKLMSINLLKDLTVKLDLFKKRKKKVFVSFAD